MDSTETNLEARKVDLERAKYRIDLLKWVVVALGAVVSFYVIDYGKLKLKAPQVVYDMPAGGRRLIQRAEGYTATVVAGAVTYRDGEATGALPGRLVRGPQAAPVASQIAAE